VGHPALQKLHSVVNRLGEIADGVDGALILGSRLRDRPASALLESMSHALARAAVSGDERARPCARAPATHRRCAGRARRSSPVSKAPSSRPWPPPSPGGTCRAPRRRAADRAPQRPRRSSSSRAAICMGLSVFVWAMIHRLLALLGARVGQLLGRHRRRLPGGAGGSAPVWLPAPATRYLGSQPARSGRGCLDGSGLGRHARGELLLRGAQGRGKRNCPGLSTGRGHSRT
jgi:hypothetical protein